MPMRSPLPESFTGIVTGVMPACTRWLRVVPAHVRAPLVDRDPTIELDAGDIEVYGPTK